MPRPAPRLPCPGEALHDECVGSNLRAAFREEWDPGAHPVGFPQPEKGVQWTGDISLSTTW